MHPSKQLGLHTSNQWLPTLPVPPRDTLWVLIHKNQDVGKQLILFQRDLAAAPAGWGLAQPGETKKNHCTEFFRGNTIKAPQRHFQGLKSALLAISLPTRSTNKSPAPSYPNPHPSPYSAGACQRMHCR